MKVLEAIETAKKIRDVKVDDTILLSWLNEIEAEIQADVLLAQYGDIVKYGIEDMGVELLLKQPLDGLYVKYLCMMIDYYNDEQNRYTMSREIFDMELNKVKKRVMQTYAPADFKKELEQNGVY